MRTSRRRSNNGCHFFAWGHCAGGLAFAFWIMVLLMQASCGGGDDASSFSPEMSDRLRVSLERSVQEFATPGAVMAVRSPEGSVWIGSSGCAEYDRLDQPGEAVCFRAMTPDLSFRIASVTKTFTATIILQLVDEGKLALDDTVDAVINRWFSPGYLDFAIPYANVMTLGNILEMRSGMVDYGVTRAFIEQVQRDPLAYLSPRDILRMSAESDDPAPYPPNTRLEYCNANFILQGIIIEQVTGKPYAQEVQRRLLAPLLLSDSFVAEALEMPLPFAHGYKLDGGVVRDGSEMLSPSWSWAAGGMVSKVRDVLTWVTALNNGTFLTPETQAARMDMKAGVIETWPVRYGLGIYEDDGATGHYGDYAGYYTAYAMRYGGYDFAVLANGDLQEGKEPGRHPARSIFRNAIRDMGI